MGRETKYPDGVIDKYLREASGLRISTITDVMNDCVERLGVSMSTLHRWRADDSIPRMDHILNIIIEINKRRPEGQKCNLKDAAILCNYKGMYRVLSDKNTSE